MNHRVGTLDIVRSTGAFLKILIGYKVNQNVEFVKRIATSRRVVACTNALRLVFLFSFWILGYDKTPFWYFGFCLSLVSLCLILVLNSVALLIFILLLGVTEFVLVIIQSILFILSSGFESMDAILNTSILVTLGCVLIGAEYRAFEAYLNSVEEADEEQVVESPEEEDPFLDL